MKRIGVKALTLGFAFLLSVGTSLLCSKTTVRAEEDLSEPYAMDMDFTRAVKGQFTDFFPDENFAEIVAKHLKKSKEDRVTLLELQEIKKLYINYQYDWSVDTSIKDFLAQTPFVEQINLEGIGYLMGLEELYIRNIDTIAFPDDLTNCYQLNRFSLMNSAATVPLELLETSLQHLIIGGQGYDTYGKLAQVPQEFIQKYERNELKIEHWGSTEMQEELQIQTGEMIPLADNIPPVLISLFQKSPYHIKTISLSGFMCDTEFLYNGEESLELFLNRVSEAAIERFHTPGTYQIIVGMWGATPDNYYTIPVAVTKAPLTKEINIRTATYDGKHQVNISGKLSGDFVEGSNTLTPEQINEQEITVTANGQEIDKSSILAINIAVSNDRIISVTVVGIFDALTFIGVD